MADMRHKASQSESSAVAISDDELPIKASSTRPLDAGEIAALRAFFDLLAQWDEVLSKSTPRLQD